MSKCHLHPQRDALGGCTSCGRFVCEICLNKVQGKMVCDTCVRVASTQNALQHRSHSGSLSQGPHVNVNTSSLDQLHQRFQTPQLPHQHALSEVKREFSSISQRNLMAANIMVTLITVGMLDSLAVVFWLPACIGLWYFWNKRRQNQSGAGKERLMMQEIFQLSRLNQGEVSLGQLAAQGRYTMDEYEEEIHKLTARGVIRQELDEEHGIIKYYLQ